MVLHASQLTGSSIDQVMSDGRQIVGVRTVACPEAGMSVKIKLWGHLVVTTDHHHHDHLEQLRDTLHRSLVG